MNLLTYPLIPFSYIYAGITRTRNWLYDQEILKSHGFPVPVIIVGNLTVGGTGKTPHIEYLVQVLKSKKIAILSRGYKRQTTGFVSASARETAVTLGDEPYQYFKKYAGVMVAVCENRVNGINALLKLNPHLDVILLDDAFQHRPVQAHLNILLTDYNRLFFRDMVLPAGRLRESRRGAQRADLVVVSKCPEKLSEAEESFLQESILRYTKKGVPVFYSRYCYQKPVLFGYNATCGKKIVLVTGIAQSEPLINYLKNAGYDIVKHFKFPDHYYYREQDLKEISNFAKSNNSYSILTTEKDWVKLTDPEFSELIQKLPIFYIPITVAFLRDQEKFDELILNTVK